MLSLFRGSLFFVVATLLVACGGGGGDAPSGDGTLTVNPTSITLETEQGGALPVSQSVSISSTNPDAFQVIAGYPAGTTPPTWLDMDLPNSSTLNVFLTTTNLSPGTYNATVRVITSRIDNSVIDIKDIPLTLNVTEATIANPTNINFSFVEGEAAPPAQTVSLSKAGNSVLPTGASVIIGGTYFQAALSGNQVEVSLTNAALSFSSGTSVSGTLRINHDSGFTDVGLYVRAETKALTVNATPSFMIDLSTQVSDLSQDVTIDTNFTSASPVDWSATVESGKPWLVVSPTSGDTVSVNTLSVSIDATQLGDLLNRREQDGSLIDHTADVTLTSTTPNVQQVVIRVTLNLDAPHIRFVSPHVATSGSTEEVIVRGWGFAAVTNQTLNCGGQPATAYTVLSDVEIRATCPSLSAGVYELELENSIGMNRNNAVLNVVDANAYGNETIPTTGIKSRIIYDPVRESIYIANVENQTLDRLVYDDTIAVGSKWVADSATVDVIQDLALSTDGSYLYAGTDVVPSGFLGIRVLAINPDTLAIFGNNAGIGSFKINSLAFLSGGEAIMGFDDSFNNTLRMRQVLTGSERGQLMPTLYDSVVGASRDGRRGLVSGHEGSFPGPTAVYAFDSASEPTMAETVMSTTGLSLDAASISSDRTGTKWIFDNTNVYTDQFVFLGALPATTLVSLMSHDGTIAYTVDSSGTLRKFDLTSVTAQQFLEITPAIIFAATPGNNPVMTLSHDGGTLFIAGDQNILILTAP